MIKASKLERGLRPRSATQDQGVREMFGKGGNGRDVVSMTDRDKQKRLAPLRLLESY